MSSRTRPLKRAGEGPDEALCDFQRVPGWDEFWHNWHFGVATLHRVGVHNARIQPLGGAGSNELLIDLPQQTNEQALDRGREQIIGALKSNAPSDKQDLNNTSSLALTAYLLEKDPLHLGTDAQQRYSAIAQAVVN